MNMLRNVELVMKVQDKLLNPIAKEYDLALQELKIMIFLKNSRECDIAQNIVKSLGLTKSHVSMSIASLEQKGYLEKTQDHSDKKKYHLKLTERSQDAVKAGLDVQKRIKKIMMEGITPNELQVLADVTKKMLDNLEKYSQQKGEK